MNITFGAFQLLPNTASFACVSALQLNCSEIDGLHIECFVLGFPLTGSLRTALGADDCSSSVTGEETGAPRLIQLA